MSTHSILPQNDRNGQHLQVEAFEQAFACSDFGQDPARWLQARIEFYEAQAVKLESELHHIKILLRGHETWLSDLQRRRRGAGHE